MLWLVLPQTQGATKLYLEYVHPTLTKHEADIEEFISRTHDQAKAAGAEYIQHLFEIAKQLLFGTLPQTEDQNGPATPIPHDAASFAQALFSRWRVPPLTPYAPQMATDFYAFLSSALQQAPGSQAAAIGGGSNLIPPHVKGTAEKARFIELQRQRLKTVMAALESEMETIQAGAEDVDAAAVSGDEKSSIHKSYSVGHLSSYEGDFDHVEMDDATTISPPGTAAGTGGWFGSWGSRNAPVMKEHEHKE
jgi:receptor expression-enhancing protein 1/2/3/4